MEPFIAATNWFLNVYRLNAWRLDVRVTVSVGDFKWKVPEKAIPKDQSVSIERATIGNTRNRRFFARLSFCAYIQKGKNTEKAKERTVKYNRHLKSKKVICL